MSEWKKTLIGNFIDFNPRESIEKGKVARKIPMGELVEFQRKIKGYELAEYKSGPKFRNDDTLVAKITPCLENGKTAFVDILEDEEVAFGSSEFIVLRANKNSIPKYIYYLARSPLFRERAITCMEGTSGRKRVNESVLKYQDILAPSLKIQQKIATILSAIDDKIELNNQINAELEAMAKTLYDYWFVQFDFPMASASSATATSSATNSGTEALEVPYKSSGGKMVYNEQLKREIPEGWEVKKLKGFVAIKRGKLITAKRANTNGEVKVVSAGLDFSYYHSESNYPEFTITVSGSGANAGFVNFWREPIFANDCTTVRGDDLGKTYYVFKHLKLIQEYLYRQAKGSAQPHVYPKDLEILNIPIPNQKLLKQFENFVTPLNKKIANNQKQNQELVALRDWLLPMLMNGQVSVGEAEEMVKGKVN